MPNLSHLSDEINAVFAYVDTVELFFRFLPPPQRMIVGRIGRLKECRDRKGRLWGYRLINNQPSRSTVHQLDLIAKKYRGILSRFDIAVDDSRTSVPDLAEKIRRQALLRWKPRHRPMYEWDRGITYWVWWNQGKRSTRNLVFYCDRYNRVTGEIPCVHLELRFLRPAVIRREGIQRPNDVLKIKPDELITKHLKWTCPPDKFVQNIVRSAVDEDRKNHRGKEASPFTDRYRANIAHRVRSIVHRAGYDRAQKIKDAHPHRLFPSVESEIPYPRNLTWGGTSSLSDQSSHHPSSLK